MAGVSLSVLNPLQEPGGAPDATQDSRPSIELRIVCSSWSRFNALYAELTDLDSLFVRIAHGASGEVAVAVELPDGTSLRLPAWLTAGVVDASGMPESLLLRFELDAATKQQLAQHADHGAAIEASDADAIAGLDRESGAYRMSPAASTPEASLDPSGAAPTLRPRSAARQSQRPTVPAPAGDDE